MKKLKLKNRNYEKWLEGYNKALEKLGKGKNPFVELAGLFMDAETRVETNPYTAFAAE